MATTDRLEAYLQRVCRSMGGPRALRDHVRQELREHLLDAAAEHRVAGLSEDAALERALVEFGEPETVRSELEATHGHRALAVVIDKTLAWKEKTMKAKWLWATWTHLAVIGIVVIEILFCWFSMIYLLPKIKKLQQDGLLGSDEHSAGEMVRWMSNFLYRVVDVADHLTGWVLLVLVGLWALFEWRFKGENKAYIRLSVLGTLGAGLAAVVVLMAAAMVLPFLLSMPGLERPAVPPWVGRYVASVELEVTRAREAMGKQDLDAIGRHATEAVRTLQALEGRGLEALAAPEGKPSKDEVQAAWKTSKEALATILQLPAFDKKRVEEALAEFDKAFSLIREAARRRREK